MDDFSNQICIFSCSATSTGEILWPYTPRGNKHSSCILHFLLLKLLFDIGSMFLFSFKLVSLLQAYSPAAAEVSPTQEYTLEVDLSYIVHTATHFTAPYCYNSTVLHCIELYTTVYYSKCIIVSEIL